MCENLILDPTHSLLNNAILAWNDNLNVFILLLITFFTFLEKLEVEPPSTGQLKHGKFLFFKNTKFVVSSF